MGGPGGLGLQGRSRSLLALNAAAAARAGVRNPTMRAAHATKNTAELIDDAVNSKRSCPRVKFAVLTRKRAPILMTLPESALKRRHRGGGGGPIAFACPPPELNPKKITRFPGIVLSTDIFDPRRWS